MACAVWGMVCSPVAEDWCNTVKRELKVSDILMWSKLMQYIKAEGVTESGKNEWVRSKYVGWNACIMKMEGRVLCELKIKEFGWVFEN